MFDLSSWDRKIAISRRSPWDVQSDAEAFQGKLLSASNEFFIFFELVLPPSKEPLWRWKLTIHKAILIPASTLTFDAQRGVQFAAECNWKFTLMSHDCWRGDDCDERKQERYFRGSLQALFGVQCSGRTQLSWQPSRAVLFLFVFLFRFVAANSLSPRRRLLIDQRLCVRKHIQWTK